MFDRLQGSTTRRKSVQHFFNAFHYVENLRIASICSKTFPRRERSDFAHACSHLNISHAEIIYEYAQHK